MLIEYPEGVDACVYAVMREAPMLYGCGSVVSAIRPGLKLP